MSIDTLFQIHSMPIFTGTSILNRYFFNIYIHQHDYVSIDWFEYFWWIHLLVTQIITNWLHQYENHFTGLESITITFFFIVLYQKLLTISKSKNIKIILKINKY